MMNPKGNGDGDNNRDDIMAQGVFSMPELSEALDQDTVSILAKGLHGALEMIMKHFIATGFKSELAQEKHKEQLDEFADASLQYLDELDKTHEDVDGEEYDRLLRERDSEQFLAQPLEMQLCLLGQAYKTGIHSMGSRDIAAADAQFTLEMINTFEKLLLQSLTDKGLLSADEQQS